MNGLIKKDMIMMKGTIALMIVVSAIFSVGFGWDSPLTIMMIGTSMMSSIYGASFAYDSKCDWDSFAVSSGISRRTLVSSKFVGGTMLVLIGLGISIAMTACCMMIEGSSYSTFEIASCIVTALAFGISLNAVCCTSNFVMENGKAQMLSTAILIVLVSATYIVSSEVGNSFGNIPWSIPLALLAMCIAVSSFGYALSMNRFSKKDL